MAISEDMQLLKEYAAGNSEEAFATLVSRHINLVYSAAFRRVGNSHQAEEITQSVFLLLAQKARQLNPATILSGWLYQTAWQTAANFRRSEVRRQIREQEVHMQSTVNEPEPDLWQQVGPVLDEAMASLGETDRNAIVLRFFENKQMKEVGAALGTSDDAAKMRVNRAIEKLRTFFVQRGVTLSSAGLVAAIGENSVQAAPAGLAASVVAGVGQGAVVAGSTFTIAKGAIHFMTWSKISVAVGTVAIALAAVEWKHAAVARHQIEQLQAQLREQTASRQTEEAQMAKLMAQNAVMQKQIASSAHDTAKARNVSGMAAAAAMAQAQKQKKLAAMLNDPATMAAMRDMAVKTLKKEYAPFAKQINMTPEQSDKFLQILIDGKMSRMAKETDMLASGDMAGVKQLSAEAQKESDASIQALLGDADFAQYKEYQSGMADRTALDRMKDDFAAEPLTDAEQQSLLQTMQSVRKAVTGGAPINGTGFSVADSAAAMDQSLSQQELINQQVLAQAAAYLTPSQLQILGESQSNIVTMTKAGYAMAQKMFDSKSNSAK